MSGQSHRSEIVVVCLGLVLAILVVYWPLMYHDFINLDDNVYVTENPNVRSGFTKAGFIWAFTKTHSANWHPLTWLSHMLDCQLFGLNAGMHHLTNLIFHIANSVLLFMVLMRMTGALWRSAFVAALFALHPLHVESVAWIAERKDMLSTLFWVLSMWAYVRYAEQPRVNRYLAVVMFFVLGLMSKAMLVTLPFVLLLMDYWPLGRVQLGRRENTGKSRFHRSSFFHLVWEKAPLFVLALISCVLTFLVQEQGGGVASSDEFPLNTRISNALVSYTVYMGKMIWPSDLSVFYPHPGIIPRWEPIAAGLLVASLSILCIRAVRTRPYLAVGWLWYLGTLVPVIGLVQVGNQAMADRYTYIPLIGLFIMIAWGVPDLLRKWRYRKTIIAICTGLILSAIMVCTWVQIRHWKDGISLFKHALNVTVNNHLAHNNLGLLLLNQGRANEAIRHYFKAIKIKPRWALAHYNMGVAKAGQRKFAEAIEHYSEAIKLNPNSSKAHNNLANVLLAQRRFDAAIAHYLEALRINPDYGNAHSNIGIAFAAKGDLNEAISHFREALRLNPDDYRMRQNLERALKQRQGGG